MSNYVPTKRHLQEVILYYFNSRKFAGEAHRMLIYAYGNGIISRRTCYNWYERFEKGDFNISRSTNKRLKKEQLIEELVRLRLEDPGITQAELAAKVGISQSAVSKCLGSQEYQNKLKEKEQETSFIPLERTTLKRKHRELEEEESLNILDEIPPITNDEIAKEHELSICKAEDVKKSVENRLESGSQPKKRPTSRTLCREWEDEELVRLLYENPGIPHSEIAKQLGMSKRIVSKRVRTQEIQSLLKDKRLRPTSRRSRREWEDGELVRLLYENPDIPHRELAIQLGISQTTLPTRINSPEIQNKLKERMQEESSIPKTLEHQSV